MTLPHNNPRNVSHLGSQARWLVAIEQTLTEVAPRCVEACDLVLDSSNPTIEPNDRRMILDAASQSFAIAMSIMAMACGVYAPQPDDLRKAFSTGAGRRPGAIDREAFLALRGWFATLVGKTFCREVNEDCIGWFDLFAPSGDCPAAGRKACKVG